MMGENNVDSQKLFFLKALTSKRLRINWKHLQIIMRKMCETHKENIATLLKSI